MKRRNFIKGLLSLAAAPLAIPALAKAPEAKPIEPAVSDVTWPMKLRRLEARMVANNIPTFSDGLYRGDIGVSITRKIFENSDYRYATCLAPPKEGDEVQFAGFRLRVVQDDMFYGVQAWGNPA